MQADLGARLAVGNAYEWRITDVYFGKDERNADKGFVPNNLFTFLFWNVPRGETDELGRPKGVHDCANERDKGEEEERRGRDGGSVPVTV